MHRLWNFHFDLNRDVPLACVLETVTFFTVPSISRLLRNLTQPIFGRYILSSSNFAPCGYLKLSRRPFFLNLGKILLKSQLPIKAQVSLQSIESRYSNRSFKSPAFLSCQHRSLSRRRTGALFSAVQDLFSWWGLHCLHRRRTFPPPPCTYGATFPPFCTPESYYHGN